MGGPLCLYRDYYMIIQHNLAAINASRQFNIVSASNKKTTEKLSSGYKINRSADGAAELAISEKMRRQIRGLNMATTNIQDGISLVQVADGALAEVDDMLHRITELSVKAANGTNTAEDRRAIQAEIAHLNQEIDRIGKTTSFNELQLFDDMYGDDPEGSVSNLVACPAADSGRLSEVYFDGTYYHASASLDFTNITPANINKLNNQHFYFGCAWGCSEGFNIEFKTDGDGTQSSSTNLVGAVEHRYTVDISDCTSGSEIVDRIFAYVTANPASGNGTYTPTLGGIKVSHSNELLKDGNKLLIVCPDNRSSATAAKNQFNGEGSGSNAGKLECTELAALGAEEDKINDIRIQSGTEKDHGIELHTHRMNSGRIGTKGIDVTTAAGAGRGIDKAKGALGKIAEWRSELGAFQNRLEHAVNINNNAAENTQAAESLIRDADMAKESLEYANTNILMQAGQSMLSQANRQPDRVLSLLQ